jgi:hypothetical protein
MISLPAPINGTTTSPIIFGNYGTGAIPIFDGNGTSTGCFQQRAVGSGSTPRWSYITIDGFECKNTTQYGVLFYQNAGGNVGMPGILIENMNIHNTGPGAYAGAVQGRTSASNEWCTNSPPAGPAPCEDGNYRNQLMFLDENRIGGGVQLVNNTVDNCGGHNCIQVQGDTTGALEQGNTCYGWIHNCMDVKLSQNALVSNNVCHELPGFNSGGACYYYENATLAGEGSITFQQNVAYSARNGVECEAAGSHYLTYCNVYNNTFFLGGWHSAISSASTSNVAFDVRNNIFDTSAPLYVCNTNNSNFCGDVVRWDYNNDGGLTGGVSGLVVKGPHDQTNVNPMYVNSGSHNFQLQTGSPEIGAGLTGVVFGTNNIGVF